MLSLLAALHGLAAQRGEGLRPDLLELLERSSSGVESNQSEPRLGKVQVAPEVAEPKSPRWADHLRF
jgi:hypothetical protein